MRDILPSSSIIEIEDESYKVVRCLGEGASSVCYLVEEDNGNKRIIKEYNPYNIRISRDKVGNLIVDDKYVEKYNIGLDRFKQSADKQIRFRNEIEDLTNYTSNVNDVVECNNTCYIDMTFFNGTAYDGYKENNLKSLINHIRALSKAVSLYHSHGYLHLDIKPANVFVIPETDELVMLYDFDSVVESNSVRKGLEYSYSELWAAPELKMGRINKISEASDVYSVGEVLFCKLFGRHSKECEKRPFSEYPYNETSLLDNANPGIIEHLNNVFHNTLCVVSDMRYKSIDLLIDELDSIINLMTNEKEYIISTNINQNPGFIGRSEEINRIKEALNDSDVLVLSGMGGIGKTELAREYAAEHNSYRDVVYLTYETSWINLINKQVSSNIANFTIIENEDENNTYIRVMNSLKKICNDDVLFIIDNVPSDAFEQDDNTQYEELFEVNARFILTSRGVIDGYKTIRIGSIEEDSILTLFQNVWDRELNDDEKKCIIKLIDHFDGNTYALELVAKLSRRVELNKIYEKLIQEGLTSVTEKKVKINKDQKNINKSSYEHIKSLFDMSKLETNQKSLIAFLSMCPVRGIGSDLLLEILEDDDSEIDELLDDGWIRERDKYISVHPLIAELAVKELVVGNDLDSYFSSFQDIIIERNGKYDESERIEYGKVLYAIFSAIIKSDVLSDSFVKIFAFDIEIIPLNYNETKIIYEYFVKTIDSNNYSLDLQCRMFLNYASVLLLMTEQLECSMKYLDIVIELSKANNMKESCMFLARAYMLKGALCYEFEDVEEGFEFVNESRKYIKDIEESDEKELLLGDINNVEGNLYSIEYDTKYESVISKYKEAYKHYINVRGKKSHDVSVVLSNMGGIYIELEDYKNAEKCINESCDIYREIYGEEHPEMIHNYSLYGDYLFYTEKYREAFKIHKKSLRYALSYYGKHSIEAADEFCRVAFDSCSLHEYDNAEKNIKKACKIYDEQFGSYHPCKVRSLWQLADIFYDNKKYKDALRQYQYIKEMIEHNSKDDEGEAGWLANIYYDIATVLNDLGNSATTEYLKKAKKLYKELGVKDFDKINKRYYKKMFMRFKTFS